MEIHTNGIRPVKRPAPPRSRVAWLSLRNQRKPKRKALEHALALDPRPHYHDDETRLYGMPFKDYDISFSVVDGVLRIEKWVKKSAILNK